MHPENKIILEVLQRHGIKQADVYRKMGIPQGNWQRKMGSNKPPTLDFIQQVANITGLSFEDVVGNGIPSVLRTQELQKTEPYEYKERSDREFAQWSHGELSEKIRALSDKIDLVEGLLRSVLARLNDKAK